MSEAEVLDALVQSAAAGDGELLVCSPAVGLYGAAPKVGEVLVGGSRAGRLTVLGRTVDLLLPAGTTGRVAERLQKNRRDPVEYGQMILRLVPVTSADVGEGIVSAAEEAVRGLPEGTFAVTSPTQGMFYRRPSPDAPNFVEPGQTIEEGATLALVEVMKCFSAITYGGEDRPPRAEVVEIRADDGAEVSADQVLFVLRPA
jgi:acetyl-CoA carboxylase biotin carboxyl carrier protein